MQIITDRRNLHQIPELVMDLPKTIAYLQSSLHPLRCKVFSPMEGSLCAWFDFGAEETIAFRADMDALPIAEKTGLAFASTHPGKMHACGHDGHMAILLELARRLNEKKELPHNVLLVFQPAEEEIGGARLLCQTGVFEQYRVKAIFGLHLWPELAAGQIFSRKNEAMIHSCEINVDIYGKSAHIAKDEEGIDALAAGVDFYSRVRALRHSLPEDTLCVLNFGLLQSGTVRNAISAHTHMQGSLRVYSDDLFDRLLREIFAAGKAVESETGCSVSITTNDGYPAVINPPELYDKVRSVVPFAELQTPFRTAEDFSWYQKRLPGMFFFLGLGDVPALHADTFNFDGEILLKGADFFEELAEKFQ